MGRGRGGELLPDAEEYLPPRAGDALRALLERLDEARVVVRHGRRLEHVCREGVLGTRRGRTSVQADARPCGHQNGNRDGELGRSDGRAGMGDGNRANCARPSGRWPGSRQIGVGRWSRRRCVRTMRPCLHAWAWREIPQKRAELRLQHLIVSGHALVLRGMCALGSSPCEMYASPSPLWIVRYSVRQHLRPLRFPNASARYPVGMSRGAKSSRRYHHTSIAPTMPAVP